MEKVTADKWEMSDCRYVDRYRKECAIKALRRKLRTLSIHKKVVRYVIMMCDFHFGSDETNDFLMQLKCYDKALTINQIED
jgi:hypothetical protein